MNENIGNSKKNLLKNKMKVLKLEKNLKFKSSLGKV